MTKFYEIASGPLRDPLHVLVEDEHGSWVLAEDYFRLEREIARLVNEKASLEKLKNENFRLRAELYNIIEHSLDLIRALGKGTP